jgi:hypothetical protein
MDIISLNFLFFFLYSCGTHFVHCNETNNIANIDSDCNILYKLIKLEQNVKQQEQTIAEQGIMIETLTQELKGIFSRKLVFALS